MKYGKLKDGKVEYAGKVIRLDDGSMVVAPKGADLLAAHYLPVVDEKPTTDDAHYAAPTGWEEREGTIRRTYEVREIPPRPPRTFDKYRLVDALMKAGAWERVKAWLQAQEGAWDRIVMAPDISEDEPLLAQGIAAVKELLSWTDAQVEAVLAQAAV